MRRDLVGNFISLKYMLQAPHTNPKPLHGPEKN